MYVFYSIFVCLIILSGTVLLMYCSLQFLQFWVLLIAYNFNNNVLLSYYISIHSISKLINIFTRKLFYEHLKLFKRSTNTCVLNQALLRIAFSNAVIYRSALKCIIIKYWLGPRWVKRDECPTTRYPLYYNILIYICIHKIYPVGSRYTLLNYIILL